MPPPDPPTPPPPPPSPPTPPDGGHEFLANTGDTFDSWSMPPPPPTQNTEPTAGAARGDGPITVGPYRLLDKIGEGGFGLVYLAERREPFVQRVALKILKPGVDSAGVIARFEQERQALALMDHPNIAKVLDGGLTDARSPLGPMRPYFVMELVQGTSITRYCEQHRLSLRARLDLFISVCEAVQHAHMKGIIHRDLKPGNILVSEGASVEGEPPAPVVKVIDFGIARALGGALTDKTIFTERGQIIGTPEYMPPEQAALGDLAPVDIDTRADVYSLGIILYELLTGSLPFEPDELRQGGLLEIVRIIREVDPPKPSMRVSDVVRAARAATRTPQADAPTQRLPSTEKAPTTPTPTSPRTTLRIRGVEPASLARVLRGDLDWIVMKAIEKKRSRRYESASSLAADIRRYLRTEPVEAGPPSAGYRIAKFVRRRKMLVAVTSICLIAIVGGLGAALYGLDRAAQGLDEARQREREANEVRDLIQSALQSISRNAPSRGLTVEQFFQRLAEQLESRSDPRAMPPAIRNLVGEAFRAAGEPEAAIEHLTAARRAYIESGRVDHPRLRELSVSLAMALMDVGRLDDAAREISAAVKSGEPSDDIGRRSYVHVLDVDSRLKARTGDREGAVTAARAAVELAARVDGERSREHAYALNRLAIALLDTGGDPEESLALAELAADLLKDVAVEAHEARAVALATIGNAHAAAGRFERSTAFLAEAVESFERAGLSENMTTATIRQILALRQSDFAEKLDLARDQAERALGTRRRLAPQSVPVAESLNLLGVLALIEGDHAAAQERFRDAVELLRSLGADGESLLPSALTGLAGASLELGDFESAVRSAGEALERRERVTGIDPGLLASTRSTLGAALAATGQTERGETLMTAAAEAVRDNARVKPALRRQVIDRLIAFHKSRGDREKQQEWEAERERRPGS